MAALLLVTGNAALQLADLQVVRAQAAAAERNSDNDQLISAAHVIGTHLHQNNMRYSCLRTSTFTQWSSQKCGTWQVTGADLTNVTNKFLDNAYANITDINARRIRITDWIPPGSSGTGSVLSIETQDQKQKKSFYLSFGGNGLRSAIRDESPT